MNLSRKSALVGREFGATNWRDSTAVAVLLNSSASSIERLLRKHCPRSERIVLLYPTHSLLLHESMVLIVSEGWALSHLEFCALASQQLVTS